MEGSGGFFPFGGDPEDLLGALRDFAERQAESVQDTQREQFATLTLNTAVELTAAALSRIDVDGPSDAQALALRDAMRVLFPEAVALVSAARQGFMRQWRVASPFRIGVGADRSGGEVRTRAARRGPRLESWTSSTAPSSGFSRWSRARSCSGSPRATSRGRRSTTPAR